MKQFHLLIVSFASAALLANVCAAQQRPGRRDRGDRGGSRPERDSGRSQPAQSQPSTSTSRPGEMSDEFKVLMQRSIFARSGVAAPVAGAPTTTTAPSAPPLSPEQQVVFVGVLVQDNEYVAFAENQQTRQLMTLRTGDDVARGKVAAITLDTIAYGAGGAIKVVHLGQNLAGELAPTSFTGGTPTTGSVATPSGASTAGMTPEQRAVLERLRQRRQRGE